MKKTCTLVIEDEVNIKFDGLQDDPKTRKKLVDAARFFVPYAYHVPSFKLGRWDGYKSYCTMGARTYLNLADKMIPIIEQAGYNIEVVDNRKDWKINFPNIEEIKEYLAAKKWPKGHPAEGEPIVLRDYQEEIIDHFISNLQSLQEISTGAGKCCDYSTELVIEIDENSEFGKYLLNNCSYQVINDDDR